VLIPALRQALCPLPKLSDLLHAITCGDITLDEEPRRRRSQEAQFAAFLREWILS